jgi:hypothetical protein
MDLSQFTTDALVPSVFRDHYALDAEKIESLYSKSKRHQWNAELDVDWGRFEPDVDVFDRRTDFLSRLRCVQELEEDERNRLFKAAQTFLLSQILHGEQAALMTCGQLVNVVPDLDSKLAAAVQVMDEARHVEVFARYVSCRGQRFPIDPDLKLIVEQLLTEHDWEAKCVGMQVILESIALSFFRLGESMAVEPVFKQSYDAIVRIGGRAGKPTFQSQFQALATSGIDLQAFVPKLLAEVSDPEGLDLEGLNDPMAQTVIPNLVRVGLVPERLAPGYLAQGFRIDLASSSVEDLHSWHPDTRAVREQFAEQGLVFTEPSQVGKFAA